MGESGCGKTTTAKLVLRLEEPTAGQVFVDGKDVHALEGDALKEYRTTVQAVFQDPWSSLEPAHAGAGHRGRAAGDQPAGRPTQEVKDRVAEVLASRRPAPAAGQPLPARVQRRAAPAHRRGERAGVEAEADHPRRAGLGAGRVDPGADHEPAGRSPAAVRRELPAHRPPPGDDPLHGPRGGGHVPGQDRREGAGRRSCSRTRCTPTPRRSSRPRCRRTPTSRARRSS